MKKSIITIVAFMLFVLAGFAQGKEHVYIRLVAINGGKTLKAIIYENGSTTEQEMPSGGWAGKHLDEINVWGPLLDKYYSKGYRLVASNFASLYKEYFFEKD